MNIFLDVNTLPLVPNHNVKLEDYGGGGEL